MRPRVFFYAAVALFTTIGMSACGGGGASAPPAAGDETRASSTAATALNTASAATQTTSAPIGTANATISFGFRDGASGSLTWRSSGDTGSLTIETSAASARTASTRTCPAPSPIAIRNPYPHPVTVDIASFSLRLPCSVNGLLFGASAYQSKPVPQTVVSTKLGNAKGSGDTITFIPTVAQLTFPAKTTLTIAVSPENSTAFTQLPAVANSAIGLTTNAPQVPNSLALSASSVTGGPTFQSACYLPQDPAGPGLGTGVIGTPSFYCVLVPGQTNTSTAFGTPGSTGGVTFTLGPNQKPDASYMQLDGPSIFAPCTPAGTGQTCSAQPFSLPVYSKAIVSNVADIAVCVPATENTDCNGVGGNTKAKSATAIPVHRSFQLLFADDASYNSAHTFGGVTLHITGANAAACAIDTSSDNNNDAPPKYSDAATPANATPALTDYPGAGPYVEFDITAIAPGNCAVTLTEDTGLKRSFSYTITVSQQGSTAKPRSAPSD